MKKSNSEFAAAGTLYSADGPKFTHRNPNYSASYFDRDISFNGAISYYSKNSKTTLRYRTNKIPMGWGTYSNSPTVYLGLPLQGYGNLRIQGIQHLNDSAVYLIDGRDTVLNLYATFYRKV